MVTWIPPSVGGDLPLYYISLVSTSLLNTTQHWGLPHISHNRMLDCNDLTDFDFDQTITKLALERVSINFPDVIYSKYFHIFQIFPHIFQIFVCYTYLQPKCVLAVTSGRSIKCNPSSISFASSTLTQCNSELQKAADIYFCKAVL